MTDLGRLKRKEELTVQDHVHMIRRGGRGTGGRPPRVGEFPEPDTAELVEAGWVKPPPEKPTPHPPSSVEEQLQRIDPYNLNKLRHKLAAAHKSLDEVLRGRAIPGEPRARSLARLPTLIAALEAEIAAGRAAAAAKPTAIAERAELIAAKQREIQELTGEIQAVADGAPAPRYMERLRARLERLQQEITEGDEQQ